MENTHIKKKRGRKSKKELALIKQQIEQKLIKPKVPKKRGRKPKGGKLILSKNIVKPVYNVSKQNVILHLKCSMMDVLDNNSFISTLSYDPTIEKITPFDDNNINSTQSAKYCNIEGSTDLKIFETSNISDDIYHNIKTCTNPNVGNNNYTCKYSNVINNIEHTKHSENTENTSQKQCTSSMKIIWEKLKKLQSNLHHNNISNKNSNCFWCTYPFDNPPIYIPKQKFNDQYEVYGCFCTPECAVAYLCNENIDSSTMWERYSLINSIYSSIYKYTKNIKPAPNQYHLLEKYYGTLTIEEYRKLLKNDNLLMVINKPLTQILPELYDDNNEFNIINKFLKDNKSSKKTGSAYKLCRRNNTPLINNTNMFT